MLTRLADTAFTVENPFLWRTKADVVRLIAEAGCAELIRYSTSCTRTWEVTRLRTHCGTCSQCIDRRFAVLAAGQEAADPAEAYNVDLLVGERGEGEPKTMLAAYVETASEVSKMTPLEFYSRFGEASRVLRHLDDSPDAAAIKVFELHQQHAKYVTGVVDRAIAAHAAAIRRRDLPSNCLLRLVCDASVPSLQPAATTAPKPDMGDNIFRQKGQVWEVRFAGGKDFILLPSKGAAYLHLLLSRPGVPLSAIDMAYQVSRHREQYALGDAGEKSDYEALAAYRARYDELRGELEEARAANDSGTVEKLESEVDWLADEVQKARGKGGRLRKAADDRDRVRKSVGIAIRRAVKQIAQYDSRLAEYLNRCLRCGLNPCYLEDPNIQWET